MPHEVTFTSPVVPAQAAPAFWIITQFNVCAKHVNLLIALH